MTGSGQMPGEDGGRLRRLEQSHKQQEEKLANALRRLQGIDQRTIELAAVVIEQRSVTQAAKERCAELAENLAARSADEAISSLPEGREPLGALSRRFDELSVRLDRLQEAVDALHSRAVGVTPRLAAAPANGANDGANHRCSMEAVYRVRQWRNEPQVPQGHSPAGLNVRMNKESESLSREPRKMTGLPENLYGQNPIDYDPEAEMESPEFRAMTGPAG